MAGMRGVNQRQMQQAMRKMGIKQTTIDNVVEVIIRTGSEEIVISPAEVVCVDMQGGRSYQISGQEETRPLGEPGIPAERGFPEEDVDLVMSQTGCDRDAAIAALKASDGQPAEAIISVISG